VPHKFDPAGIERLLREDRIAPFTPREFLIDSGLRSGMVMADLGCGPGFFTKPAVDIVGSVGRVYALDTQEEMLTELKRRVHAYNLKAVRNEESSVQLNDASVDFALMAFVFHELHDRVAVLAEMRRMLKKGGIFVLMDWQKKVEERGPPFEERIDAAVALDEVMAAGFISVTLKSINASHYVVSAVS